MFGFKAYIKEDDNLTIYFPWSYKAISLKF